MQDQNFLVIPLDARPVCYDQVVDLAQIGGLNVTLPPKNLLGILKQPANLNLLGDWWRYQLARYTDQSVIMAMDTLTYGGLISSRINIEMQESLQEKSGQFLDMLKHSHRPRYAFSSILRIPDCDNDDEEPAYWKNYGQMLYQFSVETHRQGSMPRHMFDKIPAFVIQDFMSRRQKNFRLNEVCIELLDRKVFDFLLFCQDDTGPYGFNVKEAEVLKEKIKKYRVQQRAVVQTGADEVASLLLAKALWSREGRALKVYPLFFPDHGRKIMARFDSIPVGNIVQHHIHTLGAVTCLSPKDADLILMVNAPSDQMGDHCSQELFIRDKVHIDDFVEALRVWLPQKSVSIADVTSANGGDSPTIMAFLEAGIELERLVGYAAWNTPGNSIGSALAMGAIVVWAQQTEHLNDLARRKLLLKRFLDDWYYQANVRIHLRRQFDDLPSETVLNGEMREGVELLKAVLNLYDVSPSFEFPCKRLFEISVNLDPK